MSAAAMMTASVGLVLLHSPQKIMHKQDLTE